MTRAEIIAFNAGVQTTLDHARRIAEALNARPSRRLVDGFAAESLMALAEEGRALLIPVPANPNGAAS